MKKWSGVLLLGLFTAFNSIGASTNPPPASADMSRSRNAAVEKSVSDGSDRVFAASYETVTNKLSALKISPEAAKGYAFPGRELAPGEFLLELPENLNNDITGKNTEILVTKINPESTRVHMKTVSLGLLFNHRDRQMEKQRMDELSGLLSAKPD